MDNISNLPKSLLIYILSLLPIDDAVRTTILSTKWRNLCSSLSNLEFNQGIYQSKVNNRKTRFREFVDGIIMLHDDDCCVSKLKVVLTDVDSPIEDWLRFAVKQKIKELEVIFPKTWFLPCLVFHASTLTILKLKSAIVDVPTKVSLPLLKFLKLYSIKFVDEHHSNRLISSCPSLEVLIMVMCMWKNSGVVDIIAPVLKRLKLETSQNINDMSISCANLQDLSYSGYLPDVSSQTLSSLLCAQWLFQNFPDGIMERIGCGGKRLRKILSGMHSIVKLTVELGSGLETLCRYQSLSLRHTWSCSLQMLIMRIPAKAKPIQFVSVVIGRYSNLKMLGLIFEEHSDMEDVLNLEQDDHPELYNVGVLIALDTVRIRGFGGTSCELYFVRYLLENASSLKKMEISFSSHVDYDSRISLSQKIPNFAAISSAATISFS